MSDKWYYVLAGERKGPAQHSEIVELYNSGMISAEDYLWKKGFENWVKLTDTGEFVQKVEAIPPRMETKKDEQDDELELSKIDENHNCIFIKIGADRGEKEVEYGPFSILTLKSLYNENRVNSKTFIFVQGRSNWTVLGDIKDFEIVFEELPPPVKEENRRDFLRKPLIARMFIQNHQNVFEGICRDISIGGMQVLVDGFPANIKDRISINVHPENTEHHFVASGEIVRLLEGGQGFSFRFLELEEKSIAAIKNYLND